MKPLRRLSSRTALGWLSFRCRRWLSFQCRLTHLEAQAITGTITGSLVLAADDPAALARFSCALLNVEPQPGLSGTHWPVPWPAGGWLALYAPAQSRPQPRQPGRLALCLQRKADGTDTVAVLSTWIEEAPELGASVGDPLRQEPFGAEAWLLDPEGNRLLLLVLP